MASSSTSLVLLLIVVLASQHVSAKVLSGCPGKCEKAVSYRQITSPAPMYTTSGENPNSCRRTCYYKNFHYYQFQMEANKTSCFCFSGCNKTSIVQGSSPSILGWSPDCPDVKCPVACNQGLSFTFISSPAPVNTTTTESIESCKAYCTPFGPFYSWSVAHDCNCYTTCSATKTYPGMTPVAYGYIPACVLPPKQVGATCSALLSSDCTGMCPGKSTCGKASAAGKYQCCCNKPNVPVVKGGKLTGCS